MTARNAAAAPPSPTDLLGAAEVERIVARKRPPKKWADPDRTRTTPEWQVWNEAHKFDLEAAGKATLAQHGDGAANLSVYYPEDYDKDLGDGAWVFVIDPPVTEQWRRFQVPLLSLWWARPHVLNDGKYGDRLPYQGVIQTPAGDLHLWPHEYVICRDPASIIGLEGAHIHALGGEPLLDEDMMFALMSRGIPRETATLMLFDRIEEPNFCYVTFDERFVAEFAGVATRRRSTARADYLAGRIR